jgi:hypothetical protein
MAQSIGSLYVLKSKTHKTGWRLLRETYEDGIRKQASVSPLAWVALGFSITMTLEQAKARAKQLNGENSVKRAEQGAIAKIARRVEKDQFHHSVFIPKDLNDQFIKWLDENIAGNEKHRDKIHSQWITAKKIIVALKLATPDYSSNKVMFYRYFANQEYSPDYAGKLLRIINMYGKFCARITGKYFETVPVPKGQHREMINDAYHDSKGFFGPSSPLTPEILQDCKSAIKDEQYKWLFCTIWFGLRPSELDQVLEDRTQGKYWRVEDGEVDVLWVYQPKLTSKPRNQRWKPIPVLFDEQKKALEYILTGGLQKPIAKTMRNHFPGHTTLYGGRKGFTDLMLDRQQSLENIAQWLGHSSIEMTWSRYKDKNRVGYTVPIKTG